MDFISKLKLNPYFKDEKWQKVFGYYDKANTYVKKNTQKSTEVYESARKRATVYFLSRVFIAFALLAIIYVLLSILIDFPFIRRPLGNTRVGGIVFCSGDDLCSDGRCVGETWKDCGACEDGKFKVYYRLSCEGNDTLQTSGCIERSGICGAE